jgi:germacradienol/geosmin synthase
MLDTLPNQPGVFIWDEHRFEVTDLAFFNALSHPNATAAQLELAECWLVWSTYADDYFLARYGRTHDLAGAKIFYTRLLEFMPLEATSAGQIPLTPVERGLADAWERTIKTLSASEQLLFRKIIESLISSWVWELSSRVQNRLPDPIEYIEMRRKTSGVDLLMVLHRAVYGQAVPLEVHRTCTLKELNNTAIDYACWTNDIISYQREIEFDGEMHNGVLVIQNFMGCDRGPAVEIVNQLMTARMQQFEHLVNVELPVLFENFSLNLEGREALLAYVIELQYFMSATLQWHLHTGRYLEGELRRATTRPFTGYPTGLGTTAARAPTAASGHKDINGAAPCPAGSGASPVKEEPPETLKGIKTIAVSHLALPFQKRKEEARTDS